MSEELRELSIEELVAQYDIVSGEMQTLQEKSDSLRASILSKMAFDSQVVGNFTLSKTRRIKPTITVEEARQYDVTKVEEKIDTKAFSAKVKAGEITEGFEINESLLIRQAKAQEVKNE